jgi:hypothetical protein
MSFKNLDLKNIDRNNPDLIADLMERHYPHACTNCGGKGHELVNLGKTAPTGTEVCFACTERGLDPLNTNLPLGPNGESREVGVNLLDPNRPRDLLVDVMMESDEIVTSAVNDMWHSYESHIMYDPSEDPEWEG